MGVQPSVIDALKKKCVYCKQNGAGLVCEKCEKAMHYECVIDKCKFDWETYKLKCEMCI